MNPRVSRRRAGGKPRTVGKPRAGFTLIEVLLVLAILVALGSVVVVSVFSMQDSADEKNARNQMNALKTAITAYRLEMKSLPSTLEDLVNQPQAAPPGAKWRPFLDTQVPVDPWGQPYLYQPGADNRTFELYSVGPDRAQGTEDDIHYNRT